MDRQVYIICSGGGSIGISDMLCKGGASSFFAGADIPYNQILLNETVGEVWNGKYTSERTAHQLAAVAYYRAKKCGNNPLGIGVCCTLAKGDQYEEREGRVNQVYFAIKVSEHVAYTYRVVFAEKNRAAQEQIVGNILRSLTTESYNTPPTILGSVSPTTYVVENDNLSTLSDRVFIFCGSFNPIHNGHLEIIYKVRDMYNTLPIIEIGGIHFNKPSITAYEYVYRCNLIRQHYVDIKTVYGTKSLFIDKQEEYKKQLQGKRITFIMGTDVYNNVDIKHRDKLDILLCERGDIDYTLSKNVEVLSMLNTNSSTQIRKQQRNEV